ncbi:MAG: TIGR04219 family outer membrane beta-barrel protein [Epsilonproteobacteria bacterium]|nr:TIGR04219 family outer membrane beta-barrel protein [Campylobacterota bacterium]MDP2193878.1 TIGR04219 family outer membrane beta-barrel protein [Alphaproteobacteria bacterium]
MKKSVLTALCLASVNVSAAMILGFGAEVDYYNPTASGDFNYKTTTTHFNNQSQSGYQIGLYLEHPVPVLPNIRLDFTPESSFSGSNGAGGTNIVSFDQADITPYYEILDNVVDLDIGVTFKVLEGKVEGVVNRNFSEVIPMVYLGAGINLEGTGLRIAGDVKYVEYNGDSLSDSRIKAVWNITPLVQVQGGYRYETLKINDRFDMNSNVVIEGPFIGMGVTF